MALSLLMLSTTAIAEERFVARLADGKRIADKEVKEWHHPEATPTVAGHRLDDEKNPARWLIDTSRPPAEEPAAYVEYIDGDRLPGEVVAFRSGRDSPYERLPDYFYVKFAVPLQHPQRSDVYSRVAVRGLRRIVWMNVAGRLRQPGTVFTRDRRQFSYRSLRWTADGVTLLQDDGLREFTFRDLAEVHLSSADPWESHFQTLATLCPHGESTLFSLSTVDGLRITASTSRFEAMFHGDRKKAESWIHRVQPAWSLDPLWVRFPTIRQWRFFDCDAIPLSRIAPHSVRQKSTFGHAWTWRRDRSVFGTPLTSGGELFGDGFGVHAFHEMTFDLPESAVALETQAGLDQSVGTGGCVRLQVGIAGAPKKLFDSGILIGRKATKPTGRLALPISKEQPRRLVLTADPVIEGRPKGADPFDIRDSANWCDPVLLFDRNKVLDELRTRRPPPIAAWDGWDVSPRENLRFANRWIEIDPATPEYHLLAEATEGFFSLKRRLAIRKDDRWLALIATRFYQSRQTKIHVHIDGVSQGEFDVPDHRPGWTPDAILVPVDEFRGRTVSVEIFQLRPDPPSKDTKQELPAGVDWRSIELVKTRPGLRRIFDDDPAVLAELTAGDGEAHVDRETKHAGTASARVTPISRGRAELPGLRAAIRLTPRLGEFRFIQFSWKKNGGRQMAVQFAHDGAFGGDPQAIKQDAAGDLLFDRRALLNAGRGEKTAYRFTIGSMRDEWRTGVSLGNKLPQDWHAPIADLAGSFDDFTLTGISLQCPDGEAAWFDRIYIGRSQADFQWIDEDRDGVTPRPPRTPDELRWTTRKDRAPTVVRPVAPLFACDDPTFGAGLLKQHAGKKRILTTHPPRKESPCILRAPIFVPSGRKTFLELTVSHHPEGDWQLVVKANEEQLHESVVNQAAMKDGWQDLRIDLSKFAGKPVVIELQNRATDWHHETAYWARAAIRSE